MVSTPSKNRICVEAERFFTVHALCLVYSPVSRTEFAGIATEIATHDSGLVRLSMSALEGTFIGYATSV